MESMRWKRKIASIGDMYQQTKILQALDEGVCIQIEFPAYNRTDQLASKQGSVGLTVIYQGKWRSWKGSKWKFKTVLVANIKLCETDKFDVLLARNSLKIPSCYVKGIEIHKQREKR